MSYQVSPSADVSKARNGVLTQPVLVLNKVWVAIGTIPLHEAIVKLFSTYEDGTPKAKIIDPASFQTFTWDDWSKLKPVVTDNVIKSANVAFKIPEVIMLTKHDKPPQINVQFSRRTLYKRDKYMCQYCGCQPGTTELSVDHILPSSRGGETSWTNCVVACVECNAKKANRTPEEAGMVLRKVPTKPSPHHFKFEASRRIKSWQSFISEAYWSAPLSD